MAVLRHQSISLILKYLNTHLTVNIDNLINKNYLKRKSNKMNNKNIQKKEKKKIN